MKELGYFLLFLVAISLIGVVENGINKDREVQVKELDRQCKLDSTDKAEEKWINIYKL